MTCPALEQRNLRNAGTTPEVLTGLSKMRVELPALKELDVSENVAMLNHTRGGEALAALLVNCSALEKLDLV